MYVIKKRPALTLVFENENTMNIVDIYIIENVNLIGS
jgi:hypothetical protein